MLPSQGSNSTVIHSPIVQSSEQSLTTSEAASFLAASPSTLESWRHKRRGPAFIRQGRSIRYRLADLIKFQETNRIEPKEAD